MFNTVSGKKIALLGFAFKADTGDTRETPALSVLQCLLEERAHVCIYDPQVTTEQIFADMASYNVIPEDMAGSSEAAHKALAQHVTVAVSAEEAIRGAHAIAVITEWKVCGGLT
jgi:UDPglucose 6-dehydrogenase